jgi:hypothetical protein
MIGGAQIDAEPEAAFGAGEANAMAIPLVFPSLTSAPAQRTIQRALAFQASELHRPCQRIPA